MGHLLDVDGKRGSVVLFLLKVIMVSSSALVDLILRWEFPAVVTDSHNSGNQNVIDARTRSGDTSDKPNQKIAEGRSQGFIGDALDEGFSGPNAVNLRPRSSGQVPNATFMLCQPCPWPTNYHAAFV
jgi:hypothetical protein